MNAQAEVGISDQEVVPGLEADGVDKFIALWDERVHTVSSARRCPLEVDLADCSW